MFCTNCGKKLDDGAKFCVYCGAKNEEAEINNTPAFPVADFGDIGSETEISNTPFPTVDFGGRDNETETSNTPAFPVADFGGRDSETETSNTPSFPVTDFGGIGGKRETRNIPIYPIADSDNTGGKTASEHTMEIPVYTPDNETVESNSKSKKGLAVVVIITVIIVAAMIFFLTGGKNLLGADSDKGEPGNEDEIGYEGGIVYGDEIGDDKPVYGFPDYIEIPDDYTALTEADSTYIVNTQADANLKLYYAPRESYDVTGSAENKSNVTRYGTSGEFTLIYSEDAEEYGWVESKWLLKAPDYECEGVRLVVAVGGEDTLPLRQGPDVSYEKIVSDETEATVKVIGRTTDENAIGWILVYSESKCISGWVNGYYLMIKEDNQKEYKASVKEGDNLPLREGAIQYYDKLWDIKRGETVKAIGKSYLDEKWWFVYYKKQGLYGWVNSDYLTTELEN